MQEFAEFRIPEMYAKRFLHPEQGVVLGDTVRKVITRLDSALFTDVGRFDETLQREDRSFFTGWDIYRKYSKGELLRSEWFVLRVAHVFEPEGELCGTQYDERSACPVCGSGAVQVGPLRLPAKRLARKSDIAKTIAGEIVVSVRFRDWAHSHALRGMTFAPIFDCRSENVISDRFQLKIESKYTIAAPPTRYGWDPFRPADPGSIPCRCGTYVGVNRLSELWMQLPGDTDAIGSVQFNGVRRGVLRPETTIVVSKRFRDAFKNAGLKRLSFEIARISGE